MQSDDFIRIRESKNYCFCCNTYVDTDEDAVGNHIKSSAHWTQKLTMLSENFVRRDRTNELKTTYYCFFCDSSFDAVLDHINDSIHQTNKDLPDKKSSIIENALISKDTFYFCKCCKKQLWTFQEFKKHVETQNHVFKLDSSALGPHLLKTLIDNYIIIAVQKCRYHCFFCNTFFVAALEHIDSPSHQLCKKSPEKKSLILKNNITSTSKFFCCNLCQIRFYLFDDLQKHMYGRKHSRKLSLNNPVEVERCEVLVIKQKLDRLSHFESTEDTVGNHPKSSVQRTQELGPPSDYSCEQAERFENGRKYSRKVMSSNLEAETREALAIKQKLDKLCHLESAEQVVENHIESSALSPQELAILSENFVRRDGKKKGDGKKKYYCFFCESFTKAGLEHISDPTHQTNKELPDKKSLIAENSLTIEDTFYLCNSCGKRIWTFQDFKTHINNPRHIFKVKNPAFDAELFKTLEENFIIIQEAEWQYYCFFCNTSFLIVLDHIDDPTHQLCRESPEKKSLIAQNSIIPKPRFYHCDLCYVNFHSFEQAEVHINGREHSKNIKFNIKLSKTVEEDEIEALAIKRKLDKLIDFVSPSHESNEANTRDADYQNNAKKFKSSLNDQVAPEKSVPNLRNSNVPHDSEE